MSLELDAGELNVSNEIYVARFPDNDVSIVFGRFNSDHIVNVQFRDRVSETENEAYFKTEDEAFVWLERKAKLALAKAQIDLRRAEATLRRVEGYKRMRDARNVRTTSQQEK